MPDLSFTDFNLLEGTFWIICATISFLSCYYVRFLPRVFWHVLSLDFVLFGISDFVEVYYPVTFLEHGGEWIFVWKLLCIAGFVGCFIWYLRISLQKR